jgi:hypothetical protein
VCLLQVRVGTDHFGSGPCCASAEPIRNRQTVLRYRCDERNVDPRRPSSGRDEDLPSGDKMRTNLAAGGGYMVMELRERTNFMVMNGMCMQMNVDRQPNPFSEAEGATVQRTPVGADTVDGHACKVENLTITPRDGQPKKMKAWEAEDLNGFRVKIEMESSHGLITIQYKDISLQQPDPSLFTHPDNCRQMPVMPGSSR